MLAYLFTTYTHRNDLIYSLSFVKIRFLYELLFYCMPINGGIGRRYGRVADHGALIWKVLVFPVDMELNMEVDSWVNYAMRLKFLLKIFRRCFCSLDLAVDSVKHKQRSVSRDALYVIGFQLKCEEAIYTMKMQILIINVMRQQNKEH